MCVTVRFQGTKNKGGHGHLDIPVSYDGHVCNLPVKLLWSFKNAVAFDNSVYILIETNIVESSVLEPLDESETVRMFLEQAQQ